jgi:hypothetical protein
VLSTQGLIVRPPKDQDDPVWETTVTTFPLVPDLVTLRHRLPGPGRVWRKLAARIVDYRTRTRSRENALPTTLNKATLRLCVTEAV